MALHRIGRPPEKARRFREKTALPYRDDAYNAGRAYMRRSHMIPCRAGMLPRAFTCDSTAAGISRGCFAHPAQRLLRRI